MTKQDLIQESFKAINSFKRHRALVDITKTHDEKHYHQLQMYKMIDKIELSLRAINKELRGEVTNG